MHLANTLFQVTTSFRSQGVILGHLRRYSRDPVCILKAAIRIGEKSRAAFGRNEEARHVADISARLIGNVRERW